MCIRLGSLLFFFCAFVWETKLQAAFLVSPEMKGIPLGQNLLHLEDETQTINFWQALDLWQAGQFKAWPKEVVNFGLNKNAHWFVLEIENQTSETKEIFLENKFAFADEVDLWFLDEHGAWQTKSAGEQIDFRTREIATRQAVFRLEIRPGKHPIVIRSFTIGAHQLALYAWTPRHFYESNSYEYIWIGILIGCHVLVAFYNLFLYATIRDKTFLYYVIYVLGNLIYQSGSLGILLQSLSALDWQHKLPNELTIAMVDVVGLSALLFSFHFLEIKKNLPWLRPVFAMTGVMNLTNLGVTLFGSVWYGTIVCFFTASMVTSILLLSGFLISLKGQRHVQYYFAAWSFYLAGVILTLLNLLNYIPSNSFSRWGQFMGGAIEMAMLSLALGSRVREREKANLTEKTRLYEELKREDKVKTEMNKIILQQERENRQHQTALRNEAETRIRSASELAHQFNNPLNYIEMAFKSFDTKFIFLEKMIEQLFSNIDEADADAVSLRDDFRQIFTSLHEPRHEAKNGFQMIKDHILEVRSLSGMDGYAIENISLQQFVEACQRKLPIHLKNQQIQRLELSPDLETSFEFIGNRHLSKQIILQVLLKILERTDGKVLWKKGSFSEQGEANFIFVANFLQSQECLDELELLVGRITQQTPLRVSLSLTGEALHLKHQVLDLQTSQRISEQKAVA